MIHRYLTAKDLHGYYLVNGVPFSSKVHALSACSPGQYPTWHFLDEEFSAYNWTIEPQESLEQLYALRAQQIRNKYDFVLLNFSGGIDSLTMLMSFLENDIPFDGIMIWGAWSMNNPESWFKNQEPLRVAVPLLKKLQKKYNKNFNIYFLDETKLWDLFKDKDAGWINKTNGRHFFADVAIIGQHYRDSWVQNFCMRGRTAIVQGVDKPRVVYENGKWKYVFLDVQCPVQFVPFEDQHKNDNIHWEFFYWSPDCVPLLIKQGHSIKNYFETNNLLSDKDLIDQVLVRSGNSYKSHLYYQWIDPIVYSKYLSDLPGQPKSYFLVPKAKSTVYTTKQDALFSAMGEHIVHAHRNGLKYVLDSIDHTFVNGNHDGHHVGIDEFIDKGLIGIWSKDYCLS